MQRLDGLTRRVIASHGIAALAVALPWPLLLVLVDERTEDPLLLGLVGAARLLPYVAVSWATARLADAMRRDLIVRVTLVLRAATLAGAGWHLLSKGETFKHLPKPEEIGYRPPSARVPLSMTRPGNLYSTSLLRYRLMNALITASRT